MYSSTAATTRGSSAASTPHFAWPEWADSVGGRKSWTASCSVSRQCRNLHQGPGPQFLTLSRVRPSRPATSGILNALQMMQNNDLAIILGQPTQGVGQQHGLLAADRPLARRLLEAAARLWSRSRED